ncbi:MAG: methyltransferase domain-containing protein, partial [Anaerolineales bacterium]|nr:methyltransferase domain-containing protein [Anaerolineales bacterium]
TTPAALKAALGVPVSPLPWQPDAFRLPSDFQPGLHWSFLAGLFHIQEEVSMLPVQLLDPQPGERILDLCAAPGNKTAQIAVAVGAHGTVVANDRDVNRMRATRQNLDRLGLFNVTTLTADGSNLPKGAGSFDRVLVDVPCTCEGTCRKDPDALAKASVAGSLKLTGTQQALLRKAVQLCRPGGRIVYATCTFAPEENELIVDAILRETGADVIRLRPARIPGFAASPGITTWQGQALHPDLAHCLRVWPHQHDTGGFFVAVLEKQPGSAAPPGYDSLLPTLPSERDRWLPLLLERFGFETAVFAPYLLFRWSRKRLYLLPRSHAAAAVPPPDALGMHFMNVDGKYPKLTTAAAMRFGHLAARNWIDLTPPQAAAFFARQDFSLPAAQAAGCSGTGYVLLRYRGYILGVGVYRARQGLLESLYPKGWRRTNVVM